ncbi:unnamed protein product [Acanthosepion pharaonis]|uniref:Fibrinogen C-terminal domain-containing protein n=1 Tax=Acanthosepion pharaonis TaxID=158019 RepID=A0A812DPV0_ACAPH|nr:unnamed protein product [Sepia pharaonis]
MCVIFLLCCALTTNFIRCERQTDISKWYSDMMSRGAFDGELSTEQLVTKKQIEIEKAAEKSKENIASKKPLYEDPENKDPKDCYELYQKSNSRNGAYKIKPAGFKKFIEVFCDMKCGGWTVIQRRQGGTTNFFRDWNMYKKGFGGVYGEHWIGNDIIHQLTNQKQYVRELISIINSGNSTFINIYATDHNHI